MRKVYVVRLVGRCVVFVLCGLVWFFKRESFSVLEGWNFFEGLTPFHILWCIWVFDMLEQMLPITKKIPLGSAKHFAHRFRPAEIKESLTKDNVTKLVAKNAEALKKYIVSTTKAAYKVMILWVLLLAVIGVLYYTEVIDKSVLFMISVAFYVCDLICVLIWCPFRLLMKTRCCTTCRIFNWDHFMMFSPMMFMGGFYGESLFIMSLIVFVIWELCVLIHPERFWEGSNEALKCSECTDKLCTQYCRKLR
ncbi:MAG: hypothetical protein IJB96_12910 [Lachnospira sp.]|nr:hypothetical protein [Lachnospira sp.]